MQPDRHQSIRLILDDARGWAWFVILGAWAFLSNYVLYSALVFGVIIACSKAWNWWLEPLIHHLASLKF